MMLLTTDWHPWFSYEWWNDIGVPALGAVGSIAVGAGAIVVAYRSHNLAERVRGDEQKRESDAARERYRDQLFRTVEPTVTALLAVRAEVMSSDLIGTPHETSLGAAVTTRLRLVSSIANAEDEDVAYAAAAEYMKARDTGRSDVLVAVLGALAVTLPALLIDDQDSKELETEISSMVNDALEKLGSEASAPNDGDTDQLP
ncbi:hypothetical protein DEJ00_01365 [Curtobacterium sp. MCLR17_039]|uniref:hypothetical protein n=1 Tax=Curtobacterium sp. MCLR17_039 TaxID=2175624 RepID=UPI000DA737ED|nr:hypothetical protein [Curtobacterium sp. MCLR17_039]PZE93896.1 hypothetical protein DEJ00_01365 [Curtobacterium sp. MCLR17_039]